MKFSFKAKHFDTVLGRFILSIIFRLGDLRGILDKDNDLKNGVEERAWYYLGLCCLDMGNWYPESLKRFGRITQPSEPSNDDWYLLWGSDGYSSGAFFDLDEKMPEAGFSRLLGSGNEPEIFHIGNQRGLSLLTFWGNEIIENGKRLDKLLTLDESRPRAAWSTELIKVTPFLQEEIRATRKQWNKDEKLYWESRDRDRDLNTLLESVWQVDRLSLEKTHSSD